MSVSNLDSSRWVVIYPSYINKKKTIAEGRKVPQSIAVENPTLNEIINCVKKLGLAYEEEV